MTKAMAVDGQEILCPNQVIIDKRLHGASKMIYYLYEKNSKKICGTFKWAAVLYKKVKRQKYDTTKWDMHQEESRESRVHMLTIIKLEGDYESNE